MDNMNNSGNGKSLHNYFEDYALKSPYKIAIEHENVSITFFDLNTRANQLARLLNENGIQTGDIVAVAIERSINMIVAILAILKVGGAYLPINIDYPKERNELIVSNSAAKLMLYSGINYCADCNVKGLDISCPPLNLDSSNLNIGYSSDNTACIIFTSGSTGLPKGVMLSHNSFINTLSWAVKECGISEQDNIFNKSSINFDASTFEIFLHFFTGAKLCLCKQGQEGNTDYLMKEIEKKQITVCVMVSSLFSVFIDYVEHKNSIDKLRTLRVVFSGGDRLSYSVVQKHNDLLYKEYKTKLYNLYGPAEITICCTFFNCTNYQNDNKIIPVGKPIANTNVYILDKALNLCKENEIGEIYVSGIGVGRAYVNDKELTQQKFVKDKFIAGLIMYKTGDLGKWNSDGNIEFCGRIDNQIKIRGNRVELEEIESIMIRYSDVAQAVVLYIEESKVLIAFYKSKDKLSEFEFKQYLLAKLPNYMIPTNLIHVVNFPLINTGKVDRKELLKTYLSKITTLEYSTIDENDEETLQNDKILQIIKNNVDPNVTKLITLDKDLQSAGIDSITFIKIIVALEKEFNFEFDDNMLLFTAFPNLKSFIEYIVYKKS